MCPEDRDPDCLMCFKTTVDFVSSSSLRKLNTERFGF